jgi:hypothetical protein
MIDVAFPFSFAEPRLVVHPDAGCIVDSIADAFIPEVEPGRMILI